MIPSLGVRLMKTMKQKTGKKRQTPLFSSMEYPLKSMSTDT